MAPADLAGARHPQPPAGRQLRLGLRRGLRAGVPADARGARTPPGRPRLAPLHGATARVARGRATGLHRPPPGPRRTPTRSRSSAAASTSPSSPRCRSATASASCAGWATSSSGYSVGRPQGAWLAERVWEPDLPTSLVAGGYGWTILDDAHFRAAAIPEADLWGPYTTEDQGRLVDVFGTEQGLRYRIPFRDVEEVIEYLRVHATEDGSRVGMMGDDGEKFGAWPTTWEHCWGPGRWVERFFEALEANADWLSTVTPSAWLADHRPIGRVYVPTGLVRRDGRVGAARRREPRLRRRAPPCPGGWPTRGSLAARRVLAQLPGQVPRDQRPAQADATHVREGRRDARRPGSRRGPRPPLPRPVERLLLARAVRRHLHQPHAARDLRAPHRGGGPRGRLGRHVSMPPSGSTSTSTASTRCGWPAPGRSSRSTSTRAPGSAPGTSAQPDTRSMRSCDDGLRPTTRRSGPTRPRCPPATIRRAAATATARPRRRSTTSSGPRSRGSRIGCGTTTTSADPDSSASCRTDATPERLGSRGADRTR